MGYGSGFGLGAGFPLRRLVCVTELTKAELNAMIEEATVDCHDEEEALTGFASLVEENLEVPFETTVLGVTVTVTGVTHTSHGLVADCARGRHRQAIHLLDLPLPEPSPKGAEWIAAYRRWTR
jgi:phosphohistidine swiveling domain-containing protein